MLYKPKKFCPLGTNPLFLSPIGTIKIFLAMEIPEIKAQLTLARVLQHWSCIEVSGF
jgi:hypothetical protein